jgi:DNA invertase Pin-like site-specific DNA recombinase
MNERVNLPMEPDLLHQIDEWRLNYLDDQLVLGIKGTLSVVELKVIRQRSLEGRESKARRGELFKRLPIGYARDRVGKIAFHPDRQVCEAIQLVFAKFRELWRTPLLRAMSLDLARLCRPRRSPQPPHPRETAASRRRKANSRERQVRT